MTIKFRNGRWHAFDQKAFRPVGAFKTLAEAEQEYPGATVEAWK